MQPDTTTLDELKAADWEDILPRVLLWAKRCHRRYLANIPGAPAPEDLVQDAVTDLLTGRRTMPENVTVRTVLFGIVRSHVSNFLTRAFSRVADGTHTVRRVALSDDSMAPSSRQSPRAAACSRMLFADVLDRVAGDKTAYRMVELLQHDPLLKPADLADMLGVPVHDIYNARKRLARRLVNDEARMRNEPALCR